MKTLVILGAARPKGHTRQMVDLLLEHLEGEAEIIDAYRTDVKSCMDCRYCWKNPGCCVKDEMQEIYSYIEECDNVLIASPIYFSELTGKLLDLGSRLQTYFSAKFFRNDMPITKEKKSAVLLVGGGKGSMEKAFDTAQILLRDIKATNLFPLISFHGTDDSVVAEDPEILKKLDELCDFFNS